MSSPLQICAATLLAVCLGCAVYLSPSQSPPRSETPGLPSTPLASPLTTAIPLERRDGRNTDEAPSSPSPAAQTYPWPRQATAASPTMDSGAEPRTFPKALRPTPESAVDAPIRTAPFSPPAPRAIVNEVSGQKWIIPYGAALPAPLIEPDSDATPAQIDAMDEIADAFIEDLATAQAGENAPASKPKGITPRGAWDAATRQANERYRLLFGVEAYNARTTAAAKEALAEQR